MKKQILLGMIGMIIVIIAASGCTSSGTQNKTYWGNGFIIQLP